MKPISPPAELPMVLNHLQEGTGVCVDLHGRVRHDDRCKAGCEHPLVLPRLTLAENTSYEVSFVYPGTPFIRGRPVQPRAKILRPVIDAATFSGHPHLYQGKNGEVWACPLSPQTSTWTWEPGATLAYLDQLAIWLLKTAVWFATGGGILSLGNWLGPDTPHGALNLLASVGESDPCWCGRGLTYADCHRETDFFRAIPEISARIASASP